MELERKTSGSSSAEGSSATASSDKSTLSENSKENADIDGNTLPFTLKFITWNIDGLASENLKARTEAVCKIIEKEEADIVLLQEIVPVTADYIKERMTSYHCFFADEVEEAQEDEKNQENEENEEDEDEEKEEGEEDEESEEDEENGNEGYFVGTLLKKSSVTSVNSEVIEFPSVMSRNLLKVNVMFKDLPICLLNSHLESLLAFSPVRIKQLKTIFKEMLDAPENETVIFGGDTNLREKELTKLGGLPPGIEDAWVACGSQKRFAYTFDVRKNDNLKVNWKVKTGCRFDRVFVRRSSPSKLKPVSFELIGLKRIPPYGCFPSDHWGILCHFERDNFKFKLDEGGFTNSGDAQIFQPYWLRKTQMKKL